MRMNARRLTAAAVFAAVTALTTGSVAASAASPAGSHEDKGDKHRHCVVVPGKLRELNAEDRARIEKKLKEARAERGTVLGGLSGEPRLRVERKLEEAGPELPGKLRELIGDERAGVKGKLEKLDQLEKVRKAVPRKTVRDGKICHAAGPEKVDRGRVSDAMVKSLVSRLGVGEADARKAVDKLFALGEQQKGIDPESKEFAAFAKELGVAPEQLSDALKEARKDLREDLREGPPKDLREQQPNGS
ncbi:hypothetical protein [Streptomyces sp. FIT100]|uniref:hypothetical protein n=1 Tax=Streptomyces sp. FIT100 TaxID=2837956 RepID=UPI0021C8B613|nr:hypothetical protein [Streptomyces sp. FIT100]UUN28814.1 hypothetical protein KK483_22345 [Streptomyces sp. FIT100]